MSEQEIEAFREAGRAMARIVFRLGMISTEMGLAYEKEMWALVHEDDPPTLSEDNPADPWAHTEVTD